MGGDVRVGMAGWTYAPWRGSFYPKAVKQKAELEYASRQVTSIEINGTFYAMQKPSTYLTWMQQTPDNFKFSLKAPKYITHVRRLKEVDTALANFFATGILRLEQKLGVVLWQFPAFVALKDSRFEDFFAKLPRSAHQAAKIAEGFSEKIRDIVDLQVGDDHPIQHVFEFRNASFFNPDFLKIMKSHDIGLVLADSAEKEIYAEDFTSDVVYLRMHGLGKKHENGYSKKQIASLAERVEKWSSGKVCEGPKLLGDASDGKNRDVFVVFDNDVKETAPENALELLRVLKERFAKVA